jgi:hypothetical protein
MKRVAHTLAKVVMKFWSSAEVLLNSDDPTVVQKNSKYGLGGSRRIDGNEVSEDKIGESDMVLIIFLRPFFFFVTALVYVMIVIQCYTNGFSCLVI